MYNLLMDSLKDDNIQFIQLYVKNMPTIHFKAITDNIDCVIRTNGLSLVIIKDVDCNIVYFNSELLNGFKCIPKG